MFHGGGEVIATAEAYHLVKQLGVFEGEVGGVIGAQAAARGYDAGMGVRVLYQVSHHLFEYIFFILKIIVVRINPGLKSCNPLWVRATG